jgi:hypothetical protein
MGLVGQISSPHFTLADSTRYLNERMRAPVTRKSSFYHSEANVVLELRDLDSTPCNLDVRQVWYYLGGPPHPSVALGCHQATASSLATFRVVDRVYYLRYLTYLARYTKEPSKTVESKTGSSLFRASLCYVRRAPSALMSVGTSRNHRLPQAVPHAPGQGGHFKPVSAL